ncbi:MAG: hypothetical protein ACRDND_23440 [Streptosporangiaceae bacterium]
MSATARHVFRESFNPTDPDLSEEERQRRGRTAYRAYMQDLAARSAASRRARREQLKSAARQVRAAADALAAAADEAL